MCSLQYRHVSASKQRTQRKVILFQSIVEMAVSLSLLIKSFPVYVDTVPWTFSLLSS